MLTNIAIVHVTAAGRNELMTLMPDAIWRHLGTMIHCGQVTPYGARYHYTDVIMTTMASQITSLAVVYSTVYSDADQRKHQSSASLAFVWGIHRDR